MLEDPGDAEAEKDREGEEGSDLDSDAEDPDGETMRVILGIAIGVGLGIFAYNGYVNSLPLGTSLREPFQAEMLFAGGGAFLGLIFGAIAQGKAHPHIADPRPPAAPPGGPPVAAPTDDQGTDGIHFG